MLQMMLTTHGGPGKQPFYESNGAESTDVDIPAT